MVARRRGASVTPPGSRAVAYAAEIIERESEMPTPIDPVPWQP